MQEAVKLNDWWGEWIGVCQRYFWDDFAGKKA
jgi:hypothetical protein